MAGKIRNRDSARNSRRAQEDDDGAPLMATSDAFDVSLAPNRSDGSAGHAGLVKNKKHGINLKTVAEACVEAGLDPAVEIARVLATKVPILDNRGKPKMNPDGSPMTVDLIDPDTKIRTLTELLQYNQPKLKAVEMKISGTLELSDAELDQRLTALLAKGASKK
jgi:hypothetical protein